jgi:hypothetical protein
MQAENSQETPKEKEKEFTLIGILVGIMVLINLFLLIAYKTREIKLIGRFFFIVFWFLGLLLWYAILSRVPDDWKILSLALFSGVSFKCATQFPV